MILGFIIIVFCYYLCIFCFMLFKSLKKKPKDRDTNKAVIYTKHLIEKVS